MNVYISSLSPNGTDERLAVSSSAVQFVFATTLPTLAQTDFLVSVQGADVMVTLDGSTPTASNGILFKDAYVAIWPRQWIVAAKLIRSASTDAAVHVQPLSR